MAASISQPGYWFITGAVQGQNVAGLVKFTQPGSLPNATNAIFVDKLGVKSINMTSLHDAIQKAGATFLYEVPATGSHTNLQSIGARAVGKGKALYTNTQAGIQPTNDLTIAALIAGGIAGAAAVIGGGATAAETAGAEAAGGTGAGVAAAEGGAAGGVASKVASGAGSVASKILGSSASTLTKDAALAGFLALFTSLAFWLRVGEALIGAALLLLGLRAMTTGSNPLPAAVS